MKKRREFPGVFFMRAIAARPPFNEVSMHFIHA